MTKMPFFTHFPNYRDLIHLCTHVLGFQWVLGSDGGMTGGMCVPEVIRPKKISEMLVLEKSRSSGPLRVESSSGALGGTSVGLLFSSSVMADSLWPHGLEHTRLPCPALSSGVCSNSCPVSQ